MIDKKGYDRLMAQIDKELGIDREEVNKTLDEKYGKHQFFGETAEADRKKMAEERKAEFDTKMAKRKRIRERVHFTEFGGKKKVLSHILNNDFGEARQKSEPKTQSKNITVSKKEAEKASPEATVSNVRAERIEVTQTEIRSVHGTGTSFNENALPSKDNSSPER